MDESTVFANSDAALPDRLRIGNEKATRVLSTDTYYNVISASDGRSAGDNPYRRPARQGARQRAERGPGKRRLNSRSGCNTGGFDVRPLLQWSRADPTVTATALTQHYNHTFDTALDIVAEKCRIVEPTPHLRAVGERLVTELLSDE